MSSCVCFIYTVVLSSILGKFLNTVLTGHGNELRNSDCSHWVFHFRLQTLDYCERKKK